MTGSALVNGQTPDIKAIITCHVNPDFDAVASLVAASHLYPEAALVLPGGQEKNLRNYFILEILNQFPLVKIKDLDLSKVDLLVVVDTRQKDRLGLCSPVLANPDLKIHLYDHHPDSPNDLPAHRLSFSRVGANVTLMVEALLAKGLSVSPQVATLLALGLYQDTGSFTFASTTPRDLTVAAKLLEWGADLLVVAELTTRELTPPQLSLLNDLIANAEIRPARGRNIAITESKSETHIDDLAVLAHKMMDSMGLDTLFMLVEMENLVQLVARSRNVAIDVGKICQALGGGGHSSAAAVSFRGKSLEEIRRKLEAVLGQAVSQLYTAEQLMSKPPISLPADRPMSEVRDLMVRASLNVLLADNDQGQVRGYITEPNVARAIYLGLANYLFRIS
ncbi:MAG: DHH family phosphoesterase [Deltaproteobacteria bacterium]|jgi:tRNA nucleotidyltransferase (CCA-adding enzyme)|nr:DHH family phosphoesterase [Deltaproteobacteria bacterium]